ncbi:MAG: DUF5666 domain-containing protein [Salinisphaera sp.]|nr:DUF5666 domain-containing protein [Salinisphaera sp.]
MRFDAELEGPIDTIDKGPITPTGGGNHAFVVAGQTVFVSGTTFFEDVSGFAALQPGDVVEVSGNIDANGILRASSVELQQNPVDPNNVELKGTVSILDINSKTFKINDLTVDYSTAALDPANFQPDNGQFVEVSGTLAGNSLTAHELELEDRAPVGAGDAAEIEGIVAAVDGAASTFTLVSGLQVAYGDARFEEGGPADIKTGAEVEVTGQVDASHVLQAIKIEVESDQDDPIVEVAAKVHTSASSQVTLFNGALEVQTTDDTRIKDDRDDMRTGFSVAELQPGDYVEIAATIGSGGELLATRIERDEPEDEVELKGPLASANEAARMIEILDVKVSFSAATEFEDANDNPTSEADFYAQANAGSLVKVEGRFNGNLIEAAEVSLEEDTPD